jgi:hypothetical protein
MLPFLGSFLLLLLPFLDSNLLPLLLLLLPSLGSILLPLLLLPRLFNSTVISCSTSRACRAVILRIDIIVIIVRRVVAVWNPFAPLMRSVLSSSNSSSSSSPC